jgi:hypothetical protein
LKNHLSTIGRLGVLGDGNHDGAELGTAETKGKQGISWTQSAKRKKTPDVLYPAN